MMFINGILLSDSSVHVLLIILCFHRSLIPYQALLPTDFHFPLSVFFFILFCDPLWLSRVIYMTMGVELTIGAWWVH